MQYLALLRRRTRLAVATLILALPGVAGAAGATPAEPGAAPAPVEDETAATPTVHGKDGRRAERFRRLIEMFKDDRRAVYEQYGFPTYRHFELEFEMRTEHWFYLAEDLEFVFSGDRLIGRQ